jgi:hypothetical protein
VYEEDIDHIIGILYIKDLLPYVGRSLPKKVTIRTLLRETHFVPDTKKCDELFEEMNAKHLQMAIVVDEYGGVAGIVTIEDLLESIVGNMQDEFDHEDEEITQLDDDSFEVDGTLSVGELEELLDTELPEGDYDTVAGFVLDQLGHIPEEGEEAVGFAHFQPERAAADDDKLLRFLCFHITGLSLCQRERGALFLNAHKVPQLYPKHFRIRSGYHSRQIQTVQRISAVQNGRCGKTEGHLIRRDIREIDLGRRKDTDSLRIQMGAVTEAHRVPPCKNRAASAALFHCFFVR